jgi:hypothetical protein
MSAWEVQSLDRARAGHDEVEGVDFAGFAGRAFAMGYDARDEAELQRLYGARFGL